MIGPDAENALLALDKEIGEGWFRHARAAQSADDLLHVIIGDGVMTSKIDGWIHAATMTTPFILRYAKEREVGLDLARLTSWDGHNSATRYAQWQVDFHWRIDTRAWQYLLYTKFMRRSYEDAIRTITLPSDQVDELLAVNNSFWDEVEVAYVYRMEIIERSRGFAVHPDPTAGARDHGYVYRRLLPTPDHRFEELKFELIEPELGAGTAATTRVPPAWPRLADTEISTELNAAKAWLDDCRTVGLADLWLRVRLGDRWVPTRINGWELGLAETTTFLLGDAELGVPSVAPSTGVEDRARAFAAVQAEFWRRLKGDPEQLASLLASQRTALGIVHPTLNPATIDSFVTVAAAEIRKNYDAEGGQDARVEKFDDLLALTRPLHPRFAPFDPVEPLPWQTRNPERHLARMRRLGYTV